MVALANRLQPNQARILRLDAVIEMSPFSCLLVGSMFRGVTPRSVQQKSVCVPVFGLAIG